jgi:hypothetical protein
MGVGIIPSIQGDELDLHGCSSAPSRRTNWLVWALVEVVVGVGKLMKVAADQSWAVRSEAQWPNVRSELKPPAMSA